MNRFAGYMGAIALNSRGKFEEMALKRFVSYCIKQQQLDVYPVIRRR